MTQSKVRPWLMAMRPKTLPAAVSPIVVGTALAIADSAFSPLPATAALLCALLLQIGSNFANDYFDYFKGADTAERVGPTRALASGLIAPGAMRWGMLVVFALAALIGLYLIYVGGLPILIVGVLSILAALAYTGGPFPFGYYGLGDPFVFLFFGLIAVCGTYYVQALTLPGYVVLASVPVGAWITAILVVNNLRDIETDRRAGKKTLAVFLGKGGTRLEYVLLLTLAYLSPLLLRLAYDASLWVFLPWVTLPLSLPLIQTIRDATADGPALNRALAGTARAGLLFSLALAIGIVL